MMKRSVRQACLFLGITGIVAGGAEAETREQQNARLFERLRQDLGYSEAQVNKVKEIFSGASAIGQGNPAVTKRPMTPEQCRERRQSAGLKADDVEAEALCQGKYMAPLYDPKSEKRGNAKVCIDQYEFPNIPCEYPVVWVKTKEAAEICEAVGKRLCDAHEWEGACQGSLQPPDYPFEAIKGLGMNEAVRKMRTQHNAKHAGTKRWSYGANFQKGVCAQNSTKDEGCNGGDYKRCGSNHYPSGSFPKCQSELGVFDINGNAAEHMNLPLSPKEMASAGSKTLGVTEMKGSWFIWDKYQAHEDWCRWRAPFWHGSRVMDPKSHENYHLGFRCCKDINKAK